MKKKGDKIMKNLVKAVKKEVKRKLRHYIYAGMDNITIHKNTAKDIIKILNKIQRRK